MARKVTFTPRRFLKRIWQLGNFDVSPDGRLLAFAANKGDQWSVYLLDLRTKKDRILLQSEQSVLNPEFSPDGRWIAVQSDFEGDENYNIYLVPVRGAHVQKITDTPFDSAFPRWSPDGTKIAFLSNRDGDRDNVFVVDTSGGDAKQLTNVDDIVGEIAWRPDGRSIAFSAGVGLLDYVGLVDLAGHLEKVVAFPESENAIGGDLGRPEPWSPDGRQLAFVSNVHDHLDIGVLDAKTKRVRFIVQSRWDKTMPLWAPDAKGLFYHHSTFTQPDRLILRKGERSATLVNSLREPLPKDELADATLVRYPSSDGQKIAAWLFVPRKERRRNAAVVDPHGGPESQTLNEWDARLQFLVAEGFTILAPNYRGGTGCGRAWRRLSDRDLGGADIQDIIAGGRWLIRRGHCAADRLGAIGVSYGGYAVAHVLEKTPELWAVGVSIVGYFNWLTATTNERGYLRRYDRQKMGEPEVDADLYRKFSPIYFLDEIRAPVLFTGGAHDPRCPVTEARAMVEEMRKMGKVVDYLEFADEGHWPRKISNQIRLNERTLAWLKQYLPDR